MRGNEKESNKDMGGNNIYGALAFFTQVGLIMFCTLALSLGVGYFLDRWLNTTPWFIIIFSVLGIAAAIRNMHYTLTKQFKQDK